MRDASSPLPIRHATVPSARRRRRLVGLVLAEGAVLWIRAVAVLTLVAPPLALLLWLLG